MSKHWKRQWQWGTAFLLLALILMAARLLAPSRPSATEAVHNGMTLPEVHDVLGPSDTQYYVSLALPDGQALANGGIGYEEWERLDGIIQVFYDPRTGLAENITRTKQSLLRGVWMLIRQRLGL